MTLFNTASSAALQIDYTVSEDAGIVARTVATSALSVRRSNYSTRSHPQTRLDRIHISRVADPDSGVKIAIKILLKYILRLYQFVFDIFFSVKKVSL